jgi:hypothetical protein
MRGHSYTQAPDGSAFFYLPTTLEPATQDRTEQLRRVMQKCAALPMVCTANKIRMGARMYFDAGVPESMTNSCMLNNVCWGGGNNVTYFIFKLLSNY